LVKLIYPQSRSHGCRVVDASFLKSEALIRVTAGQLQVQGCEDIPFRKEKKRQMSAKGRCAQGAAERLEGTQVWVSKERLQKTVVSRGT
jgi:hypothetical protein